MTINEKRTGWLSRWLIRLVAALAVVLGGCGGWQMPIDSHPYSANWITISDPLGERVIGYVLVTGTEVAEESIVTKKGKVAIAPRRETWFAADNADVAVDPAALSSIKWTVQTSKGEKWREQLTEFINESKGLLDQAADAHGDLTAPSGEVSWSEAEPASMEGLPVFVHRDGNVTWYFAIERKGDALTKIVWGSTRRPGRFTLPSAFGQAGSFVMDATTTQEVVSIFASHQSAGR